MKDNFDNSFIDKVRHKVPMLLENDKKKGRGGSPEDNMVTDH